MFALKQTQETETLQGGQGNSQDSGILIKFLPAGLTLLVIHFFEFGKNHGQKLHYNSGGNIGSNSQHNNGKIGKAASGKNIQEAKKLIAGQKGMEADLIYSRNGNVGADSKQNKNKKNERNFFP